MARIKNLCVLSGSVVNDGYMSMMGGWWEDESVILLCLKAPVHRHFKPAIGGWEDENEKKVING